MNGGRFYRKALIMGILGSDGILGCFGSPEVGVCIRNVESMDSLFRIFGISDIEIVFLLQPNDVSS
jgi:hypothetical protein